MKTSVPLRAGGAAETSAPPRLAGAASAYRRLAAGVAAAPSLGNNGAAARRRLAGGLAAAPGTRRLCSFSALPHATSHLTDFRGGEKQLNSQR